MRGTRRPVHVVSHGAGSRRRAFVTIWAVATLVGLLVARVTRLGPILLVITPGHGIHVGDVVTFAVAYGVAAAATLVLATR